jgi:hypothetical protein
MVVMVAHHYLVGMEEVLLSALVMPLLQEETMAVAVAGLILLPAIPLEALVLVV